MTEHRAGHGVKWRTEPDNHVSEHLMVGPPLAQARTRPVGGAEAARDTEEPLVVVTQKVNFATALPASSGSDGALPTRGGDRSSLARQVNAITEQEE